MTREVQSARVAGVQRTTGIALRKKIHRQGTCASILKWGGQLIDKNWQDEVINK
jgi:hypothetical protein